MTRMNYNTEKRIQKIEDIGEMEIGKTMRKYFNEILVTSIKTMKNF